MHHTKDKGDLGVFKTMLALQQAGYVVCLPVSEHADFDLVGVKGDSRLTFQVKYRKATDDSITLTKRNSWVNTKKAKRGKASEADYFVIYNPDTDCCYFVSREEAKERESFSLRIGPCKNNQKAKTRMASDYLKAP
jgi:hypothetical protein